MGRYHGSVCRLCRREGMKLYLKGEKCYTEKCPVHKRPVPPGMHGTGRRKLSEFGIRLREKQKLRRIYGVLETQFKTYFQRAAKSRGVTGVRLLQLLETRLDNVVYRLGFAMSRKEARQLVLHEHPRVKELAETGLRTLPTWLEFSAPALEGRVLSLPAREEIDVPVQEQLIVEYYSR